MIEYGGGSFTFIKKRKMSVTAELGKLMLLSSQGLRPIEKSAAACN